MTLVTPALLIAGLCAVAIPILIHLLARQRRRPIEWAAMRFLIEAFKKHRRRLQLEQLLLLAVRCLILALLGFALARPIITGTTLIEQGGARTVTLVIDNGLASSALGDDHQPALRHHIDEAVAIVHSLGPGDSVSVVSAARPAKALLNPPSSDLSAVVNLLQSITPRQSPSDLSGAMSFVREAAADARKSARPAVVYLLSDFRAGSAPLESPLPTTLADVQSASGDVRLFASPPASTPLANVQIVAVVPGRSMILPNANDGSNQVKVRLERHGGELGADVSRVRLSGEGLPAIAPVVVQWKPGQSEADAEFMLDFGLSTDRKAALTASIDDDALTADNQRLAVLDLRSQLRVLLIDRRSFGYERSLDQLTAGQWIRRALAPLEGGAGPITIAEAEPAALDIADLRTADVAIMPRPDLVSDAGWKLLRQFVDRGGMLLVMPPAEVNIHQWATPFTENLALPWRLALEAVDHAEGLGLAAEQPSSEMLRMISSDLPEMARPVQVYRVLPVETGGNAETQAAGAAAGAGAATLLRFADGSPMLISGSPAPIAPAGPTSEPEASGAGRQLSNVNREPPSAGLVLYLAVAPEVSWTNLPTKPLMVPLVHEIVRQGLSMIRASQKAEVGDQPSLALAGPAARDLHAPDGRIIPLLRGKPQEPLESAGVYSISDESKQTIGLLAVNVDPRAGVTDVQSEASVQAWLTKSGPWTTFDENKVATTLGAAAGGSPIAGILLMIVLALVILETVLARWFSHAYRGDAGQDHLAIRASITGTRLRPTGVAATQEAAA